MRTIAIANQAGSAGKTTTAVSLAGLLAERGYTVRVIDSDAQSNATFALGVNNPDLSISDVLLRRASLDEVEVPTKVDGLFVVPSTTDLDGTAVALTKEFLGGEQRLKSALAAARPVDVTIIDCPGARTILTVGALVAADSVVTVTQPTLKELAGVPMVQDTIDQVKDVYNPTLHLAAVVPCVVPPASAGKVYEMALDLLRATFDDLVTPEVRRSTRVPEAYSHQVPLHLHAPREGVTDDYRAVLDYLIARGIV